MKLERFQCHLYGQFLRLCLVASTTYQMRRLLWEKHRKEMSALKCAYMVQIYLKKIHTTLFFVLSNILFQCLAGSFKILVRMEKKKKRGGTEKQRRLKS
jgi:hypothetical protein